MKKMTLLDKALLLKQTPLFDHVDLHFLLAIADKLGRISFETDDEIFTKGDIGKQMYFIVHGHVSIRTQNHPDTTLLPGDFFGEESLLSHHKRKYAAVAKTATILLTLSKTNLIQILSENPAVALALLEVYAEKIPNRFENHDD
ncbi:MAG: cyclic nucleotide-binding domain-containing protein [Chlamydiia bacterium]|nr:cyclic nucleotide-binding domain-containing protein [Chlamydiia bacterium]